MQTIEEALVELQDDPPGIVIRATLRPVSRPAILAFIWGGKVRPVPALPYGKEPERSPVV